jgi:hypothetical protein
MRRTIVSLALFACLLVSSGCATIVGTVAGPVTNAVDMPRWFLDNNDPNMDFEPEWTFLAVLFVPFGLVTGPVYGFVKGVYVDVQGGLRGNFDYSEGWGRSYQSIWRPATYRPDTE